MRNAVARGRLIEAGPDAPKEAQCPICGGRVQLRIYWDIGRKWPHWVYRHKQGEGLNCPRRKTRKTRSAEEGTGN